MKKEISLYIHIPFCVRKCLYCDFLSAPAKEAQISRYVELLIKEIAVRGREYGDYRVKTVYIGGGTPSLLSGGCILQIMTQVYRCFEVEKNCEVSLEANPGTVTYEKLTSWREAGVNRISLGLQSLQDGELKALGRIHDSSTFFATYR
ncbi:MAG: radical SAM protein, partial [Lachnospiraceae bacterium]|nr:radical SAM protein [Lachnospiraceae bacterium]